MERMIIADTDFLSAFFKINRLEIIFTALKTKEIVITGAVLHELEKTSFYEKFLGTLQSKEQKIVVKKVEKVESSEKFGLGELESIYLAENTNSLLLMNDRVARKLAESKGIAVMDIATLLLYCKENKILFLEDIRQIIKDLKEKDYYEFSREVLEMLLE